MGDVIDFPISDLREMQGLAQQVTALRPDLVVNESTVGELAWVCGKDRADLGDTWRVRLWREGGEAVAWGWTFLPYKVKRSDGGFSEFPHAHLAWQVHPGHPGRPELIDEIIDWYDTEAAGADRGATPRAADTDALARFAAHGYTVDEWMAGDDGFWQQLNRRELTDLAEPVLPAGFRFVTAEETGPRGAVRAHVAAWHPSTFTETGYEGVRRTWPYRADLHVMIEAPDGTLVSTAIMWFDEHNRTAEFEPVGTHQGYRRQGLSHALLLHGMRLAREAGATAMTVSCLAGAAHVSARGLYHSVGFRPFTHDAPRIKRA